MNRDQLQEIAKILGKKWVVHGPKRLPVFDVVDIDEATLLRAVRHLDYLQKLFREKPIYELQRYIPEETKP